jgi:type IV secretion system protein VirB10
VPADTTIPLELKNAISSRTAYVGQAVYCETIYPVTVGNRIVIPVGSYVKGAITQVVRPGRVKGKAQIGLRFDSLTLPDGTTRPLRATLSSYAGNGKEGFKRDEGKIQGESSKGQDVATVAQTAGEGAIIGAIAGRSGKGAGIGGGAGALGGLIWVLATRGKEIVIPERTSLELQLTAPLEFDRSEVDAPENSPEGPALPRRDPGPSSEVFPSSGWRV